MTIHSFSAEGTTKEEPSLLSNYLTGQLPAIELPLNLPPRFVTMVFAGTSEILKEYFGGDRPSTPLQDTSDPRVFTRTHSSAVSSLIQCKPVILLMYQVVNLAIKSGKN